MGRPRHPDRRRALRLTDEDLLPEDLALGLAMAGVSVEALGPSPVDGRPLGYVTPEIVACFFSGLLGR